MELAIDGFSDVINDNFKEFCSMEETLDDEIMNGFLNVCSQEVKQTIITQFGLSQFFDHFKDGGNVTTVHNAKKDIFPDKQVEAQFKEAYNRKNYDNKLPKIENEDEVVKSYLTNKTLKKDKSTHADHIVSAKEIHSNDEARLYMDKKERSEISQSKENIEFLEGNINQSKGSKDLLEWADHERTTKDGSGKTNEEYFSIDKENAKRHHKDAHKFINKEIRYKKVSTVTTTGINQGFSMGKKQVLGMFMYEVIDAFSILSFDLIDSWKNTISIEEKISSFKETLVDSYNLAIIKIKRIKSNVVQTFISGVTSGFIANLLTFLINQFATTLKSLAKVLNDSVHALINAFKILVKRPEGLSFKDACKEASKIVAAAITASLGVALTESLKKFLMTTPIAPFAPEVGTILGAAITGIVTALVLYLMDNYRVIINKISNEIKGVMKYATITSKEIEQIYLKTMTQIDEIYNRILTEILDDYKELNRLMSLAHDFNQLGSVTFDNSIKYAEHIKVDEDKILHNLSDIDHFFLN